MRRKSREPELVSAADAALLLGVYQNNLRTVRNLPEPYQDDLATGDVWRISDILDLAMKRDGDELLGERLQALSRVREERREKRTRKRTMSQNGPSVV